MQKQTQSFNELNNMRSIPYEQFFGEMDLTPEEIERRIGLAEELDDIFFYLFVLAIAQRKANNLDRDFLVDVIIIRYLDIIEKQPEYKLDKDKKLEDYVNDICKDIVDTTLKYIDKEYYTSDDRAKFISENETNTICNAFIELQAIEDGKTQKTWVTMRDKRVRHTHVKVDEVTIGINELFTVGKSLIAYPGDSLHGADASEIVNCRCVLHYS